MSVVSLIIAAGIAFAAQSASPAEVESRLAMRDYSRCVVDRAPAKSAALLAMDFRTAAYQVELRKLATNSDVCLGFYRKARFAPILFAGGLAERLIEREHVALPEAIAFNPLRPILQSRGELETMALCLSLQHPAAVAGLLATKPASDGEDSAMADVIAVVPQCLAKDTPLRVNRPGLRALVATAAYRIIRSIPVSSAPMGGN